MDRNRNANTTDHFNTMQERSEFFQNGFSLDDTGFDESKLRLYSLVANE